MQYLTIEIDGTRRRVPAVRARGRLWYHWLGQTFVVDLNTDARRTGGASRAGRPGVITAPMPGKVTRVGIAANDPVAKGQVLVVMEAMKMEYTLEADVDGRVAELNVAPGAQVGLGDVLVRVDS